MNSNKNNKAFEALKAFESQTGLHPLRQAALKSQLLERVAQEGSETVLEKRMMWSPSHSSVPAVLMAVFCVLIAGGAAFATETSTPGDIFHPIKLAAEKIELRLAPSNEIKAEVEARQANERIEELATLRTKASAEAKAEAKAKLEDRNKSIEVETKARVEHTLSALERVRADLDAKGNDRAVKALDTTIERLKNRAAKSRLRDNDDKRNITPVAKPKIEVNDDTKIETEIKTERENEAEQGDSQESEVETPTPRLRLRN